MFAKYGVPVIIALVVSLIVVGLLVRGKLPKIVSQPTAAPKAA